MWDIRRASLADRDALVELCTAAVGPADYAIDILEDLILRGVLQVALDGDRLVGAMQYRDALDGSGWLAVARTHPSYRRRGVASALLRNFAGLAARKGVPALRLWSEATNVAGGASARSAGFQEVARFARVKRSTARPLRDAPSVRFTDDLLTRLRSASLLRLACGYIPFAEAFIASSPSTVHLLCSKASLRRVANGIACVSPAEGGDADPVSEWGLVSGTAPAVLRSLPAVGGGLGCKEVAVFVPHDRTVLFAARAAGFRPDSWGRQAVLFEKSIEVRRAPPRTRPTYGELAARSRGVAAAHPPVHGPP